MRKLRVTGASFSNNYGTVNFEDGTKKDMSHDDFLIYERDFTPRSISKLVRYVQSKGGFYDAGHQRKIYSVWTDQGYYWFNGKNHLIESEFVLMMKLLKRYQRFYNHIKEVSPQWKKVRNTYWADNSIDEIQVNKYGVERTVMVSSPSGDACF